MLRSTDQDRFQVMFCYFEDKAIQKDKSGKIYLSRFSLSLGYEEIISRPARQKQIKQLYNNMNHVHQIAAALFLPRAPVLFWNKFNIGWVNINTFKPLSMVYKTNVILTIKPVTSLPSSGMMQCVIAVADKVFEAFLTMMADKVGYLETKVLNLYKCSHFSLWKWVCLFL